MDLINEKHQQIHELKAYLTATDYKVTKAFEQGYALDAAEMQQRENARQQITTLEVEIAEIEKKLSDLQEGDEYIPEVLTQETTVENDKYTTNYFANGVLIKTEINYKQQPVMNRITDIEQVTTEVITALNDKGIVP